MYVFSNSRFEISRYQKTQREMTVTLQAGSFYVDEPRRENEKSEFSVTINSWSFSLTGTRVYFSVDPARLISIICYDGGISASALAQSASSLFVLAYGQKALIKPDGTWEKSDVIGEEEKVLDDELKTGLPGNKFIKEISLSSRDWQKNEIPPYSITVIGNVLAKTAVSEQVQFYSVAETPGRSFILNQASVFTLDASGLIPRPGLISGESFRTRPVAVDRFVVFVTASRIILVDANSLQAVKTIQLPSDGSIDHNFLPRSNGGTLYIPVQNNGYFTYDTRGADSNLRLLVKEPFPISPVISGEQILIGSYYSNYIGAVNAKGETLFKTPLAGSSFLNFIHEAGSIYLYSNENGNPFIIRMNESGKETGRWRLSGSLSADFQVYQEKIYGIATDGNLFSLDTMTGNTAVIKRIFHQELSTRQWRNTGLLIDKGKLYAPTDAGIIIVYDLERLTLTEEISVNASEEFFTAPFLYNGVLHCIANSGNVYRILKNER
jgi:outer membrane protein assembly factor BamB